VQQKIIKLRQEGFKANRASCKVTGRPKLQQEYGINPLLRPLQAPICPIGITKWQSVAGSDYLPVCRRLEFTTILLKLEKKLLVERKKEVTVARN
jgi:hypothetical protein